MATRDKTTSKVTVGGTSGGNASFPSLPSAGSTIFVMLFGANGVLDYAAGSVTDNQSNTYTQAVQSARNSNGRSAIFYAENIGTPSGTFTITVNTTAGTWFGSWVATSYTGLTTSIIDKTTSSTGSSTTPTTTATATTSQADEVVVSAMQIRSAVVDTITVESLSPAWVEECEELDGVNQECGESDIRIVTATAAMTGNWTSAQSATWTACIATFKATPAGPTINTQPKSNSVPAGRTAIFDISATTSGGALSYQWKFNGSNVGTNSATYGRVALVADNGGAVTCAVTDSNGTTTSSTATMGVSLSANRFAIQQRME